MAASFRSAGTWAFTPNNVATPATLSPGAPAGVAVGDCLILVSASRSITATAATPSGWTLVTGFPKRSATASGGSIYVWTRIADGTASDTPSVTWSSLTTGTSGDSTGAGILCYQGLSATLDGTVQASDLSAQTTTSVIPAFTTGSANSMVIGVAMKLLESSGQTSTVATFTERADASTTSGTGHIVEVSDKLQATAGSSGTATVTWSATTSARALAVSLGLKAAASPTTASPGVGAASLAGLAPAIALPVVAKPAIGTLTATGLAPKALIGVVAKAALGLATLAGLAPTVAVSNNQRVTAGLGSATLAGQAATVLAPRVVTPGLAQLSATAFAPTAVVSNNIRVAPAVGTGLLSGLSPRALVSVHVFAGVGAVTATGFAPSVTTIAGTVTPGTGGLTVAGAAPAATATTNVLVRPGVGAVLLAGAAPAIALRVPIGAGSLAVSGFAPRVTASGPIQHAMSATVGANARAQGGLALSTRVDAELDAYPRAIVSRAINGDSMSGTIAHVRVDASNVISVSGLVDQLDPNATFTTVVFTVEILKRDGTQLLVPTQLTANQAGDTWTITLSKTDAPFELDRIYTAKITATMKDASNNDVDYSEELTLVGVVH